MPENGDSAEMTYDRPKAKKRVCNTDLTQWDRAEEDQNISYHQKNQWQLQRQFGKKKAIDERLRTPVKKDWGHLLVSMMDSREDWYRYIETPNHNGATAIQVAFVNYLSLKPILGIYLHISIATLHREELFLFLHLVFLLLHPFLILRLTFNYYNDLY